MTAGKALIADATNKVIISKTSVVSAVDDLPAGTYKWVSTTSGLRGDSTTAPVVGDMPVRVFQDVEVNGVNGTAFEVTIDASNFPGTYKIIGETVVRNRNGKDTPFQFVIPKAKHILAAQ